MVAGTGLILAGAALVFSLYGFRVSREGTGLTSVLPEMVGGIPANQHLVSRRRSQSAGESGTGRAAGQYVVKMAIAGFATIEGPFGTQNVVPGMELPGAGIVRSISLVNGQWVVVTTEAVIGAAASE